MAQKPMGGPPGGNPLGTEKISKLLVQFAIPAILSSLLGAIYNLTDQAFIGQRIGYLGNAATTVAYTLAQAVQFLYEQDRLLEKPVIQIVDGYAHIQVYPRKCAVAETLMTFWVAQAGAFVLERNFPQAVSLMAMEASA